MNVGNTEFYFYMCENFDYTGTDSLDLTGTISLLGMFAGASSFNGDISNWDVSSVTNMAGVFYEADSFNQLLNTWNVSSVTYMYLIFSGADSFNQDLSGWDVDQVTSCSSFNESAISWELVNQIDFIGKGSSCDPSPIIPE